MAFTLGWIGRRGRAFLIVGLLVGLFLPALAELLRPWIGLLVALLLFVTGMRVGARNAFGSLRNLAPSFARIVLLQTALPLVMITFAAATGFADVALALAVCLMLAAPSLTGAPNFAIMMGRDPAPGMRLLVLSTAVFPLTALPVFLILDPAEGGVSSAISLSFGLLLAILVSVGAGFTVRHFWEDAGRKSAQEALDGCAALLLAVVVVGLMSAIGPLLQTDPRTLLLWLLAAVAVNFTLVFAAFQICNRFGLDNPLATAVYAGNRNIALFLIVLPGEVAAPLMVFVGCYQIPMYLTPVFLSLFKPRDRAQHKA